MFASAVKKPDIFLMARIFNDYSFAKNSPIRTQNAGNHAKAGIIAAGRVDSVADTSKIVKKLYFPVTSD
jgi:hypothetical protein